MKTQHEKYLERLEQLILEMEEDAIPQIMQMFEAFALRHRKKVVLRLVLVRT